jgi:hypothetical protein
MKTTSVIIVLTLSALFPQYLMAQITMYSEPFAWFGDQANQTPPGYPNGTCAASSAINSFIYLENQYPNIYGAPNGGKLTPNYNAANNNDPTDALNFGVNGFGMDPNNSNNPYPGYYPSPLPANSGYVATKTQWFNTYAPGTTTIDSWYLGTAQDPSNQNNMNPTPQVFQAQLQAKEDVEFFIQGSAYHVLTLTDLTVNMNTNPTSYTVSWLDCNDTSMEYSSPVTFAANGQMQITGVFGYPNGSLENITAAFAESPIPEPSTFLMLVGMGAVSLLAYARRWRTKASC